MALGTDVLSFALLRYVPDIVRGEFVNIGVILWEPNLYRMVGVRFLDNWERVARLDPRVDPSLLAGIRAEFETQSRADSRTFMAHVRRLLHFANTIQMSPPKCVLSSDPSQELTRLYETYVADTHGEQRTAKNTPAPFSVKRRHERHTFQAKAIVVSQRDNSQVRARTENLSTGGLFIRARAVLPPGELVRVTVTRAGARPLAAHAIVRHSRALAGMGMEFTKRDAGSKTILLRMLQRLGSKNHVRAH